MESDHLIIIVALVVLVLMSAYFSATETAFTSLSRIRLKNMAYGGNKRAKLALELSENYDKLISTILIGNNIVNITSASLATVVFVASFGDMGVTLSTVVMTAIVLIFGEISPKSIAKDSPESFAMFSAPILKFFIIILTPLNVLFMWWKILLSKIFKSKDDRSITDEELLVMVEEARMEGGIDENEGDLIRNAIEFTDLEVSDIVTPRVDVVAVNKDMSREEVAAVFKNSGFSRLPVYDGTIDNIVGVILNKDLFNTNDDIKSILKPIIYIPFSTKISALLALLQKSKTHIAVVTDEFGGTTGIVTLEDILEELVGEIWDEHDDVIEEVVPLEDGSYLVNGSANTGKLFELLHEDEPEDVSSSVSGWVLEQVGKIPNEGDKFVFEGAEITVTKMDSRRVVEIRVIPAKVPPEEEEEEKNERHT